MNCLEFRKVAASSPSEADDAAMAEHARECALCSKYAADMRALDARLGDALRVPAPERPASQYLTDEPRHADKPASALAPALRTGRGWYALAASLVAGLGLVIGWRVWLPPATLADAVVAHIQHEPDLLALPGDTRVDPELVASVLKSSQVSLNADIGEVAHAGLCLFRGTLVAHLIVSTDRGPVTVLMLPDEQLGEATPINEEGFVGTIVPAGAGSIAIIGDDAGSTRSVENRIVHAVDWSA